eukprot:jgi/Mesvir1/27856/Mv07525-RA.1
MASKSEENGGGRKRVFGKDRVALVTGGSRGIGKAVCLALAREGCKVVVNYRGSAESADAVVSQIKEAGGDAVAVQADVSSQSGVASLFDAIESTYGDSPYYLVNNAGILGPNTSNLLEIDVVRDYQEIFGTNVLGSLLCTSEFLKRARGKKGAIVNLSSVSAAKGKPVLYGMSKAALDSMMAGLVSELAPLGIRINSVSPGLTRTSMAPDEKINASVAKGNLPFRRSAEPEEVADTIVFLLSDASSYTTGANVRISGGVSA